MYRNYEVIRFPSDDEEGYYDQAYNAIAKKEDCVLLPRPVRRKANKWKVPRKSKGVAYGFGQSNVWFAQGKEDNEYLRNFLNKIVNQIEQRFWHPKAEPYCGDRSVKKTQASKSS